MKAQELRVYLINFLLSSLETSLFVPRLSKVLKQLPYQISKWPKDGQAKPLIFDVGANIGQSIKLFRKLFPNCEIHAFEPDPESFFMLRQKFSNHSTMVNQSAVSDFEGFATLHVSELSETSTLVPPQSDSQWHLKKARIMGVSPDLM